MKPWFVAALVTALFFGLYNVFVRLAAGKLPDAAGSAILEGSAFVGLLLYILIFRPAPVVATTAAGWLYAVAGGICVTVGTVFYFYVFRHQSELTVVGPVVWLGTFAVMAVIGLMVFREPLTVKKSAGLILAILGIYFLQSSS